MQSAKPGDTIHFVALGGMAEQYMKALPKFALQEFERLETFVNSLGQSAAETEKPRLRRARSCLDRLASFCLQVSRLAQHAHSLSRRPVPPAYERAAEKALVEKGLPSRKGFATGTTWVRTFDEACIDFESLLFHGRAGLDVLTRFIAGEHGQYNESFSDLRKILANNCPQTDSRGLQTLRILDEAPGVTGVLVDVPGEPGESAAKSMRSKVAHYTSLQQGLRSAFTMSRLENGRLLIFDASALGYPVLATARVLAQDVPFVMLAGLATYLATPGKLTRAGCAPEWRNPTVVFDDFVDLENRKLGVNFGVVRPDINGFAVHWDRLRPEVVRAAIPFTPPEIA